MHRDAMTTPAPQEPTAGVCMTSSLGFVLIESDEQEMDQQSAALSDAPLGPSGSSDRKPNSGRHTRWLGKIRNPKMLEHKIEDCSLGNFKGCLMISNNEEEPLAFEL